MDTSVTIFSVNTPQGHRDVITTTYEENVNFLVRTLNDHKCDVGAMQEFGPLLEPHWGPRKRWALVKGENNSPPGRRVTMNAIAYRKDKLRLLDKTILTFKIPNRYINMVAALFEQKSTGAVFVVIAVHVPTRKDASFRKRLAINTRLMYFALKCRRLGYPVFIAGDRNDGHIEPWNLGKFTRGVQHQVDWILGKGVEFFDAKKIYSVFGKVTDHPAMIIVSARFKINLKAPDNLP